MGKELDSTLLLAKVAGITAIAANFGEDWKLTLVGVGVYAGAKGVEFFDNRRERKIAESKKLDQGPDE